MKKIPIDIIILHMCTINENYMMYVWFLRYVARQTQLFLILDHFLTFYPPNNPENQNFEKIKKVPRDIIISQYQISSSHSTINDNKMMYDSWDMKRNRQVFLSFWTIFCSFTPPTTQKIKILKKMKKHLKISSFYTSVPKIIIICYTVPEIWRVTDVIVFFILGYFLPFHLLNSLKN